MSDVLASWNDAPLNVAIGTDSALLRLKDMGLRDGGSKTIPRRGCFTGRVR